MTAHRLDAVDRSVLRLLQTNARATLRDVAAEAHLSVSGVRARLSALVSGGLISGWRAQVDARAVGFTLHAVVRMKVHGALYDKVVDVLEREPQIVRCLRVTGETCYLMEVLATDMADLERITSALARVGSVTTDLVYEVVADRPVPVDAAPSS